MKATYVVLIALSLSLQITELKAQHSDALSSLLQAKVQEETNAITEMYLLYDIVPFAASENWQQTDAMLVNARNSVQTQKQFAGSVAELSNTVSETTISVQPLSLEEQIQQAVKQEESALFQSYLNDRYIENLTNGTCYRNEKAKINPKTGCNKVTENNSESL
ncbi:hypothetical protein C7N43_24410 [Sphingobacteriales bacterium UPWRP_1]|nr:hypothetical protein C7N43_24410 [Sphingobacteriales bacterium UPWRP_1]